MRAPSTKVPALLCHLLTVRDGQAIGPTNDVISVRVSIERACIFGLWRLLVGNIVDAEVERQAVNRCAPGNVHVKVILRRNGLGAADGAVGNLANSLPANLRGERIAIPGERCAMTIIRCHQ